MRELEIRLGGGGVFKNLEKNKRGANVNAAFQVG